MASPAGNISAQAVFTPMLLSDFLGSLEIEQIPAERRMTTRLLDYWKSLRENGACPSRTTFKLDAVPGLAQYGFSLDLSSSAIVPVFGFLGTVLKEHVGLDLTKKQITETPDDTLLSVVARHYVEVLERKAPVGIESELVDRQGTKLLFRGVLLPFSEDGTNIDFILGAITYADKLQVHSLRDRH